MEEKYLSEPINVAECATLDIDIGNTRAKWRLEQSESRPSGAILHGGSVDALSALPVVRLDCIRVANVTPLAGTESVAKWLERRYGVVPVFARSSQTCGDVTCAYQDPQRLGVDRWLAMLAARRLSDRAFAVADLGTAATLDFVDSAGRHRGGYIVPGLHLMVESLLRRTADVKVVFEPPECLDPASNTIDGVNRGALAMLCDFVTAACERFQLEQSAGVDLLITGGDAEAVAEHIQRPNRVVPDLVLDGLAIAIP